MCLHILLIKGLIIYTSHISDLAEFELSICDLKSYTLPISCSPKSLQFVCINHESRIQESLQIQFNLIRTRPNFQDCFQKLNHSRSKWYGLNLNQKVYLKIVSLLDLGCRSVDIDAQYIIIGSFLHHHSPITAFSKTPSDLADDTITMDVFFLLI